jgi:RNA-directed DNA polymerase
VRSRATQVADALAGAFLVEGPWTVDGLVSRGAATLGQRKRWLRKVATKVIEEFSEAPAGAHRTLARFVAGLRPLQRACGPDRAPPRVRRWPVPVIAMREARWPVPHLATTGDLAHWLGLSIGDLSWFADTRGLERLGRSESLRHYRYAWHAKASGGYRLLEAPKPRLKAIQRQLLDELLEEIPAHEAAHGFRRGRSTLSHAAAHAGKAIVLRIDLVDFFMSIAAARVRALFVEVGYPEEVAHVLACLCTNVPPVSAMRRAPLPPAPSHADIAVRFAAESRARVRHLPQGAPTSPALANLCAHHLDVRLTAAASLVGAVYTRYADDLVFSGDASFARQATWFTALASGIAMDEGFLVNHRKTRRMGKGAQQRVGGLVVNDRARAPRDEYDQLRATLHNCARTGLAEQNRAGREDFRAFLQGRIAWVSSGDARRGARLRALFERITPARD